jgi:hypothetical protein
MVEEMRPGDEPAPKIIGLLTDDLIRAEPLS